ncbi:MAG: HisA/HisF-related TIM barrel protein, partial [Lysobacterales bacterium]
YGELARRVPGVLVQASGGIRSVEDVRSVRSAGCCGAIIGRALLEGRIDLSETLGC